MRYLTVPLCAMAGLATAAVAGGPVAEPAVLDVSGDALIVMDLITFVGSDNATSGPVSVVGTLTLSSSDFSTLPGDLDFVDLDLMFVPAAEASAAVDGGKFLGTADGGLTLTGLSHAAVCEPVPDQESGIASFNIALQLAGEAISTYSLIGIEPQTDLTLDLASFPLNATLDIFTIQSLAGVLTVEASIYIETVTIPFEPGLVEIMLSNSSSVNLSATGSDPTVDVDFCSRADLAEPCGLLDLTDITTFVAGFTSMDPIADFDGSGLFDLNDIVGFVTAFTTDNCDPMGTYYCYGYAAIEFDEGNAAYAMGDHTMLTAGIALSGCALMLGFGTFRRKTA